MTFTLERMVLAALALVGAGAVFMARSYGDGTGHGGNLVPIVSGGIVAALSLAAIFRPMPQETDIDAVLLRPWIVLAGTVAFLALMPFAGYPIVAPLWVAGTMMVLGARNLLTILATAAGLSIIAYLLLAKLAFAPPPMGPFGG